MREDKKYKQAMNKEIKRVKNNYVKILCAKKWEKIKNANAQKTKKTEK